MNAGYSALASFLAKPLAVTAQRNSVAAICSGVALTGRVTRNALRPQPSMFLYQGWGLGVLLASRSSMIRRWDLSAQTTWPAEASPLGGAARTLALIASLTTSPV